MIHSESIKELSSALAKAQGKIKGAVKDSANPFFKSSYADLASVIEAIREPFAENGLAYIQSTSSKDQDWYVETMITHASGEWIKSEPVLIPIKDKTNAQAFGSSHTYMKRYCLMGLVGIAPVDDDGNEAAQPQRPVPNPLKAPPPQRPAPNYANASQPIKELQSQIDNSTLGQTLNRMRDKVKP